MFKLLLQKWDVLIELKTILNLPYLTTVALQKKDFTLSDFYGCMKIIEMKLNQFINSCEKKYTTLATKLQICLKNRMQKLLDNPLLLVATFLDPRYKVDIDRDTDKLRLVELTIDKLFERIKSVELICEEPEIESTTNKSGDLNSLYAELDEQYEAMGYESSRIGEDLSRPNRIRETDLGVDLSKYEAAVSCGRMKSCESVMAFWNANKSEFGLLYKIASVIFSVPPTQASVERSFSALKFLFGVHRCNLSEDLLEASLLIHLNPDIYYYVKEIEIEELAKSLNAES